MSVSPLSHDSTRRRRGGLNRPLLVVFGTLVIDALGLGLVFPILPALLRDVTHVDNVVPYMGATVTLYAVMQLVFSPVLGALSDRLGRRPVLLISLAGSAVNYLFLAVAPNLSLLLLGRAIAGLSSANVSVAIAYVTDISAPDQRSRRFGLINAMFGIGFAIGPVLGGALGDHWLRLPFIAAAVLTASTLVLAFVALPESQKPTGHKIDMNALNPFRALRWLLSAKSLLPIAATFFLFSATGQAYGVCWALWGADAFHWNRLWIGLSLGAFGLCQTLAQVLLPGPAVRSLGERPTILIGIAGGCIALTVMAFATEGWMVFAIMPLFALAGIGVPALQTLAARQVDASLQGQFQGVLASAVSLASIACPLVFSSVYAAVTPRWPGAVWFGVVLVYGLAVPLVMGLRLDSVRPRSS